ncbi:MAG TPA: hypothetical protein VHY32_05995 [Caulobacteraceae bacterium]|nr:hypothetical protein [Caulobacteraceae bacterium]
MRPVIQHDLDARAPWLGELDDLPVRTPAEAAQAAPYYASIHSLQHPDHDTDTWPTSPSATAPG